MTQAHDTPIVNNTSLVAIITNLDTDVNSLTTAIGNLNTLLGNVPSLLRWGVAGEPDWIGGVTTTPGAGTVLATKTVTGGKSGQIFGVIINSPFADIFTLNDNAAMFLEYNIGANGSVIIISPVALQKALAATHVITIKCAAGGTGAVLAKFLYYEA